MLFFVAVKEVDYLKKKLMELLGKAMWTIVSGVVVGIIVQAASGQPAAAAAAGGCACAGAAAVSKPF